MNKLVVQQVKSIFNSLPNKDLDRLINLLINAGIVKNYKQIGYKCVECTINFKQIHTSGFGRDENEATHICLKNFVDQMLDDEGNLTFLRNILKELKQIEFQDHDIEILQQKIGNISIIQNNQNYQTVDSLLNAENEQILAPIITKKFETIQENKENVISTL